MKKVFHYLKKTLIEDASGQGTAEYVLLLVGIIAVGFIFKDQITSIVSEKLGQIQGDIMGFTSQ